MVVPNSERSKMCRETVDLIKRRPRYDYASESTVAVEP